MPFVERLFAGVLEAAFRHRRALLISGLAVTLICTWLLTRVVFDTNVLHLFPQKGSAVRAFQAYLEAFGSLDRLYVVFEAPPDRSIAEYDAEIGQYVDRLRALDDIESVDAGIDDPGRDWGYVLDRQLLLLGPGGIDEALARFSPPALDTALAAARDRLMLPSADLKALVQQDPLGLLVDLRDRFAGGGLPLAPDAASRGYVSADGRARLVLAKPTRPPFDSAFARALNERVKALRRGLPPEIIILEAGGYRVAAESEAIIKRESIVNSATSLAGILALVAVVFRSLRPLVAVTLPIVLAAVVTIAVYGGFQPLSAASAGSAGILFGLGVDNTLLLYVTYLERRRAGLPARLAVKALAAAVASVAIAFTTTAATFLGLLPVDMPALQDLGRIAGFGVLVCGVFAVLLFPALVPERLGPSQLRPIETPWLPALVRRHRRAILVVAGVLTAGLGAASFNLRVNPAVQQLEPATPEGDIEEQIARRFGLPEDAVFAVGEGADLEPLLEAHARLASAIVASGADVSTTTPVALLPSKAEQQRTADRIARAGIDPAAFAKRLGISAAGAGFRPNGFGPFVQRLPRLLDPGQRLTLEGFREHGLAPAISNFVAQRDGRYITVTYIYPRSPAAMGEVERAVGQAGGGLHLTGLGVVNRELESRFVPEFVKGSLLGIAGVVVLIIAGFRSVRLALWSLVPVVLGVWWSAGILALAGFDLDLFSVFGVLMCIGIGVDYGVHMLHRRSEETAHGTRIALTRTAPAILLSGLTAIIGFGSFIASSYGPLHALGVITAVTIATCLVTSLLVLPALLGDV
jgi:predicted RND superfamily exporter protein